MGIVFKTVVKHTLKHHGERVEGYKEWGGVGMEGRVGRYGGLGRGC